MPSYKIIRENGNILRVGFGDPAQNDQIVKDAIARLKEMATAGDLSGGGVIKVNGPASLPVAMAIAHAIDHLFEAVACFDPKLGKYVVAITHGGAYKPGDLID